MAAPHAFATNWNADQVFHWDCADTDHQPLRHAAGTLGWRLFCDTILSAIANDQIRSNWLRFECDCVRRLPREFFGENQEFHPDPDGDPTASSYQSLAALLVPPLFPDLLHLAAWPMDAETWGECINGHSFRGEEGITFLEFFDKKTTLSNIIFPSVRARASSQFRPFYRKPFARRLVGSITNAG